MPNRLQFESSPYLLQHAENPVDWYPWGEEAFRRAAEEDRPVFVSIGYSTCHWCHVMAHESFESEKIAALLNRFFVCVKVDREERPDIDSVYMEVCQAFTGSGGWPTSIFMTPEQEPFFVGTYFPPTSRGGMVGLQELLQVIIHKWQEDRPALLRQAKEIVAQLQKETRVRARVRSDLPAAAAAHFRQAYDREFGGFGTAPKFPSPHNLLFLLAYSRRDPACLPMAEHTLLQMYRGGLFDHIGFGFCRYSTDRQFLVPHFEKMLYDNALLILAYCKAYRVTGKELYREIAEKTAQYVLREMTSPQGGFYSAQDADSDGEEGKYYLFTPEELEHLLGPRQAEEFCRRYDITAAGNFEGKSIPNLLGSDPSDKTQDSLLEQVYSYRKGRCRLHVDDKILTAWNGLMISALCRLYRASGKREYLEAARRAEAFLWENLWEDGRLFVSFREEKRGAPGFLDDYAACIFAQLELYGATLAQPCLDRAGQLCAHVLAHFQDEERGGFYLYGGESEALILRPKETYDGAMPSGNSLMAWNLVRLSHLTEKEEYAEAARRQLDFLSAEAANYPAGHAMFLLALLDFSDPPPRVVIVPAGETADRPLPLFIPPEVDAVQLSGPTAEYSLLNGKTTFYVCRNHACHPPVNEIQWASLL